MSLQLHGQPRSGLAVCLDAAHEFITRHVVFHGPSDADAIALWAVHTFVIKYLDFTPRLVLVSPEKESGKSRVLECLETICWNPFMTFDASVPSLFRFISTAPTILYDEIDTIFGPGQNREDLRAIMNAGYRRGGQVLRVNRQSGGWVAYDVFAPMAIAGNELPPDTVVSRSILITMLRRRPDQPVEPFRMRAAAQEGERLRERFVSWAKQQGPQVVDPRPLLPLGVNDRAADTWESLLTIAELAGDDWTERGRQAAVQLTVEARKVEPSRRIDLLADIRAVMDDLHATDGISTQALLLGLKSLEGGGWEGLTDRDLSATLKRFVIGPPTVIRGAGKAGGSARGYRRSWFNDVWARYLRD